MGLIDKVNVEVNGSGDLLSTLSTYTTKILKPNIVDGKNILTQAMISSKNTKYVIKYDYELEDDITVPANCILEFDGGSISGAGTLTGTNTGIRAELVKIFNTNVTLLGTWNVVEAYPEWFGAKGDGVIDDTEALCKVVTLSKNIILNGKKNYLFTPTNQNKISVTNHIFFGNGCTITANGTTDQVALFFVDETQDLLTNGANVELYDMTIVGIGSYEVAPSQQSWMGSGYTSSNVVGFHCIGKSSLIAKNIKFKNLLFGIRSGENSLLTGDSSLIVEDCTWNEDCILPIAAQRYTYVNIKDCEVNCKTGTDNLIHHFYFSYLKGVAYINNCNFVGGTGYALTLTSCEKEIFVSDCHFNTNRACICCDYDEAEIIFDNCYLQSNSYPIYVQGGTSITVKACSIQNIPIGTHDECLHIMNGGTIEMIGCVLQGSVLCNDFHDYKSIIHISNSVIRLISNTNSIRVITPNNNDSEIIIAHSTINTSLNKNGVLAEIANSIVCKIIDCIINRDELGNFLFAPDASMFDNFYFNNCLAYNVSAMFASWVTPKGNITGSQII